jgi:hypothetical protein
MANVFIFNSLPWNPPVISKKKFLTAPKLTLNVSWSDEDVREMPAKQKTIFTTAFNQLFDTRFNKLGNDRIKAIQDAMDATEAQIESKPTKEAREEVVATANKMLEKAFITFQDEIEALCAACYKEAFEKSLKEMKQKLVKAKAKAVAKIVIVSLLILTAAALAIAASVASGGAAAPLILGAIVTGGSALWKVYKETARSETICKKYGTR